MEVSTYKNKMGIYKITNLINNMVYIGSTVDFSTRKRNHFNELRKGIHHSPRMQNSFNKYGEQNFKFEIVELIDDRNILREREQHWLDKLKSYNKNIGFNICRLATGGGTFGEDNPNYGNKGIKNPLSKQILQIDPVTKKVIKTWGASIEIFREKGWHSGGICKICILVNTKNIWKKYKNYYWCYLEDKYKIQDMVLFKPRGNKIVLKIDIETNQLISTYNTITEAANSILVSPSAISNCCRGITTQSGGFYWRYSQEIHGTSHKTQVKRGGDNPNSKKVVQCCIDDLSVLKVWGSISEASHELKISANGIYSCLSNPDRLVSGGYAWFYYDNYITINENFILEKLKGTPSYQYRVCLIDNNNMISKIFTNINDACDSLEEDKKVLSKICQKGGHIYGNHRIMYKRDYDKYIEEKNKEYIS